MSVRKNRHSLEVSKLKCVGSFACKQESNTGVFQQQHSMAVKSSWQEIDLPTPAALEIAWGESLLDSSSPLRPSGGLRNPLTPQGPVVARPSPQACFILVNSKHSYAPFCILDSCAVIQVRAYNDIYSCNLSSCMPTISAGCSCKRQHHCTYHQLQTVPSKCTLA